MRKLLFACFSLILAVIIFTGCSNDKGAGSKQSNESLETSAVVPSTTKPESKPLECDWSLHVDQTIPITTDGLTVNYKLIMDAQKKGGIDVVGKYNGSAYLEMSLDASNLSNEVIQVTGGFNFKASTSNLEFQVVAYDVGSYSDYGITGGVAPLAPLVKYENMALLSPVMHINGILNPNAVGIQGEKAGVNEKMTQDSPIPMKITIIGGQVRVEIPSLNMGRNFEGMLLGTAINSK